MAHGAIVTPMRTPFAILMLCVVCVVCGCRKEDFAIKEVKIGGLTEQDKSLIMKAIGRLPGVDVKSTNSVIDVESGILYVRHDTMLIRLKNVEYAISDIGFSANEIPAQSDPEMVQKARAELMR